MEARSNEAGEVTITKAHDRETFYTQLVEMSPHIKRWTSEHLTEFIVITDTAGQWFYLIDRIVRARNEIISYECRFSRFEAHPLPE
jgi:hypothetical protein